ncbi:AAA family ATPase [Candidatus Igneacidithiobacillus taiwanensis]|uniref:AAA family ATPase n=1 Tax=Candidatus Igneacidithiobacillus taiwanensis TaxID=1945924 RepID=UPI00289CC414|nr:AAA family ATPase [Candidatus Igneacidithiobacillus taiwanensis]
MADLREFPSLRGLVEDDDMPPFPPMEAYAEPPVIPAAELPEPQPLADIPRVDVAGVIDNPSPAPEFIWDGLVPRGFVTLLSGHGGSGKSTLALQLAVAVAMGLPLLGVPTTPGRVLVFSGEDAGPLLRHRLASICRNLDASPRALAERLMVLDATEYPALGEETLDRDTGRRHIAPTIVYERLREIVTDWRPALVVIDNASDTYEANENERSMVRGFVRSLAALSRQAESRPAVLLLTHTPKQAVGGRGESYSGSTAWHNSARARLSLTPTKDDESRLVLSLDKLNLAPLRREPLRLVRSHGGVLALDEGAPDVDALLNREPPKEAILRLLSEFVARGEWVSSQPNAPKTNAWALLSQESDFPKAIKWQVQLQGVLRDLERDGLIERTTYRTPSRKVREVWGLTLAGWQAVGKEPPTKEKQEPAPSAPSAPTPEVGTLGTVGAEALGDAGAPSAPSSPIEGVGEWERAEVGADSLLADDEGCPL